MIKKPSFFSRITGASDDMPHEMDDEQSRTDLSGSDRLGRPRPSEDWSTPSQEPGGELAVDVYQTPDSIVVKALVAGVVPNTIDISLTREMLTISGKREEEREVEEDNFFQRELYWGAFSRTILLPEEVDVDMAEASEKHGILIIRLPKVNKKKEMKLKVRTK